MSTEQFFNFYSTLAVGGIEPSEVVSVVSMTSATTSLPVSG
jgi:hypothetical protein